MAKQKNRSTPGQKLWLSLYRADEYEREAAAIAIPPGSLRMSPERGTRRWLEGMSRHLKGRFGSDLREVRIRLELSQQQLAEIAKLSATGVAMIERGERVPSLDTAARLCWALDVAAGVTLEDLSVKPT